MGMLVCVLPSRRVLVYVQQSFLKMQTKHFVVINKLNGTRLGMDALAKQQHSFVQLKNW